jgi:hypothetical protein
MKLILNAFFLCTIIAAPAAAQDYYGAPGAYDRYNNGYDRLGPVDTYLNHRTMAAIVTMAR